ncbi:DUF397 domain-containing protein [Nocardia speluncae]|uniref:DUF397 domain-containing protein n=1 Tax=Nocardia speluncae TaxID=419477 RepID=A0A846XSK0_9NOCA|nr:DUF397 domain-containing protein [Nocardia speluncae]NKY36554.1 DUF397 domain-containing protein [Nocardia speluncae]
MSDPISESSSKPSVIAWRKSSFSGPNGNCVELSQLPGDLIGMRNSRDPQGAVLSYTRAEFATLLRDIKGGRFDSLML